VRVVDPGAELKMSSHGTPNEVAGWFMIASVTCGGQSCMLAARIWQMLTDANLVKGTLPPKRTSEDER
jgi:hypothetical protein